jgi:hypothetical protein
MPFHRPMKRAVGNLKPGQRYSFRDEAMAIPTDVPPMPARDALSSEVSDPQRGRYHGYLQPCRVPSHGQTKPLALRRVHDGEASLRHFAGEGARRTRVTAVRCGLVS